MNLIKILLVFSLFSTAFPQTFHDDFTWKSYTFKGEISDFAFGEGQVWCATSGGIFSVDLRDQSLTEFSNTEGLMSNNVVSVEKDNVNNIWFAFREKGLMRLNLSNNRWDKKIIDISGELKINDICIHNNRMFIANDIGISEYLLDKDEIRSNFKNLGGFTSSIKVRKTYVIDDTLWAITAEGIAFASLDSPNLQDPEFWTNYSVNVGSITGLTKFKGMLYIGTENGVFRLESNAWSKTNDSKPVHFISSSDSKIFFSVWSSIYCGENINNLTRTGFNCFRIDNALVSGDTIFTAANNNGLHLKIADSFYNYLPDNPGGNTFNDLTIDKNGKLYCTSGVRNSKGVYTFYNGNWETITPDTLLNNGNFFVVEVDENNRKWLGTPGHGLIVIDDNDGFTVKKYDHSGDTLAGSDSPEFVIVEDIKKDSQGNIWLINNFANNGKALVCVTPENEWYYFSVDDGLRSNILNTVSYDDNNRIWIGSRNKGIFVLDYNGTLGNKSDDSWFYLNNNELRSNTISALDLGLDGTVWIGTPDGINYYSLNSVGSLISPVSSEIHCFAVDGFDNLWVGTDKGLGIFNFYNYEWNIYTTENSPLIDNNINSIEINRKNGDIFIGTNSGMSKLTTPFKSPDINYSNVIIYPNPFVLSKHNQLIIKNLTGFSSVSVFSENGGLIRKLTYDSSFISGVEGYWDGKDGNGQKVSSGIYIIAAADAAGNRKSFKIAVIR
ncbi:hypothetical protein ACFL4T_05840 [candidate division KSB1 bacterium]